jgi:hypothetical protein
MEFLRGDVCRKNNSFDYLAIILIIADKLSRKMPGQWLDHTLGNRHLLMQKLEILPPENPGLAA